MAASSLTTDTTLDGFGLSFRRSLYLLVAATAAICSSSAQSFEIDGVVRDNSGAPVVGATVYINPNESLRGVNTHGQSLETDSAGRFHAILDHGGRYGVQAHKQGYSRRPGSMFNASNSAIVELSDNRPNAELELALIPAAGIKGRLIDFESGSPLRRFPFRIREVQLVNGKAALQGGLFFTDDNGEFAAETVEGNFLIEVGSDVGETPELVYPANDEDVKKVDRGYARTYFPGGTGLASALPITLRSGVVSDLGDLAVREEELYRVRIDVNTPRCHQEPDQLSLHIVGHETNLDTGESRIFSIRDAPCKPFLFRYKQPGTYELALIGQDGQHQVHNILKYTIVNENLDISVSLNDGSSLQGKITLTDEAADSLSLQELKIALRGAGLTLGGQHVPRRVSAEGSFLIPTVYPGRSTVQVDGLGTEY